MEHEPRKPLVISRETLLPIGVAVAVILGASSIIVWGTNLASETHINARDVAQCKVDLANHIKDGESQSERLIRIEEKVDTITKRLDSQK